VVARSVFMHPPEGQPTAAHTFDPDAYDEALRAQAHAWEDGHRDDDRGVTGETDQ
jgi:hypothetical protein